MFIGLLCLGKFKTLKRLSDYLLAVLKGKCLFSAMLIGAKGALAPAGGRTEEASGPPAESEYL
jgi:hypothetical protein